jgi:hypothetical protein
MSSAGNRNIVPRFQPGYRAKNAGLNKYYRRAVKRILLARDQGAKGQRLDRLLKEVYTRLMKDLKNPKQKVDWVGVTRLLQLFGTVLDKEKYTANERGMNPDSQANLRPPFTGPPILVGLPKNEPKPDN